MVRLSRCIALRSRWPGGLLAAVLSAAALSACGSGAGGHSPGTHSGAATPTAMTGRLIFQSAGCAGCHTLAAADAVGNVGPDLDTLKPAYATVVHQVTHGGGGMPSFGGRLTPAQIDRVARFVTSSTH